MPIHRNWGYGTHHDSLETVEEKGKGIQLQDAKAEHCFSADDFFVLSNDG